MRDDALLMPGGVDLPRVSFVKPYATSAMPGIAGATYCSTVNSVQFTVSDFQSVVNVSAWQDIVVVKSRTWVEIAVRGNCDT